MMYMEKVWQKIKDEGLDRTLGFDYAGQIQACSEIEIAELEKQVGLKLPLAYIEFLRWAGKGLGDFEFGSRFFYDDNLAEIQEIALEIMAADELVGKTASPDKLPEDAFVFWMHEGYMFCFFRTSEGDDPPIHFFREGVNKINWNYKGYCFTDFLIVEMRDQARHIENARQTEARLARDWQNA